MIGLIAIEIAFSAFAYYEGRAQFRVLRSLEASAKGTADTIAALQQTTEQMNKAIQEQVALSYDVAIRVQINFPDDLLEITNEGHTRLSLWGTKIGDDRTVMLPRPDVMAPGAPISISAERIAVVAQEQMNKTRSASIPLTLFLKNEKGEEFLARYALVNGPNLGPFTLHAQAISVTRVAWNKTGHQ